MKRILLMVLALPLMAIADRVEEKTECIDDIKWAYEVLPFEKLHFFVRHERIEERDFAIIKRAEPCDTGSSSIITNLVVPAVLGGYPVRVVGFKDSAIRESLKVVSIPEGVLSIDASAFRGYHRLISVSLPSSLLEIASQAFFGCESLKSVRIPSGVKRIENQAFWNCKALESVELPSGAITVGGGAFRGCPNLADENGFVVVGGVLYQYFGKAFAVTIPRKVTRIGCGAFKDCTSLISVTLPESVTSIEGGAFENCWSLSSVKAHPGLKDISAYAFPGCTELVNSNNFLIDTNGVLIVNGVLLRCACTSGEVVIPSNVTCIGQEAFSCCNNLTSIVISAGVKSIDKRAFDYNGRNALRSISIPSTVTTIDGDVHDFADSCDNLKSATIPAWLTASLKGSRFFRRLESVVITDSGRGCVAKGAFGDCRNLKNVTIGEGVPNIGIGAFGRCKALASVKISSSVSNIGAEAFLGCSQLSEIEIPHCVTSIGARTFEGCCSLRSAKIPSAVTNIGERAFYRCESLTSVTIPAGTKSIGKEAFEGCYALSEVTIPPSVTEIGERAFWGCDVKSVVVPTSVVDLPDNAFPSGCKVIRKSL